MSAIFYCNIYKTFHPFFIDNRIKVRYNKSISYALGKEVQNDGCRKKSESSDS